MAALEEMGTVDDVNERAWPIALTVLETWRFLSIVARVCVFFSFDRCVSSVQCARRHTWVGVAGKLSEAQCEKRELREAWDQDEIKIASRGERRMQETWGRKDEGSRNRIQKAENGEEAKDKR